MLYLNHPLLTTSSIIQYFETEVVHRDHDASSLRPSPLRQLQHKLKAIFFEHLDKHATCQTVLETLAMDERFADQYFHLKQVLTLIFTLTDASDKTYAHAQLVACKGSDWATEHALTYFTELTAKKGYFEQPSQAHVDLFKRLAVATHVMLALFERNNASNDTLAYEYAYKLMVLFADLSSTIDVDAAFSEVSHATYKLLNTSESCKGKPFHDVLLVATHLPMAEEVQHLAGWRALIKREGEKALPFFQMAKKIEATLAEQSNETMLRAPKTLKEAQNIARFCTYSRALENPDFAVLCAQYKISEWRFNACLDYLSTGWPKKTEDNLPSVVIKGQGCAKGFCWVKLPVADKRALILGEMTDCCQSIAHNADVCVRDAVSLSDNGLYVLLRQKEKTGALAPMVGDWINDADFDIVGQSYVWISLAGNLCLDSIEYKRDTVTPDILQQIMTDFSNQVLLNHPDMKFVTVGRGGHTPENLYKRAPIPEIMRQGTSYGDAHKQYCMAKTPFTSMTELQMKALQTLLEDKPREFCACIYYLSHYITNKDVFLRDLSAVLTKAPSLLTELTPHSMMGLFIYSQTFTVNDLEPVKFDELENMSPEQRSTALMGISTTRLFWRETEYPKILKILASIPPSLRMEIVRRSALPHGVADVHPELLPYFFQQLDPTERLEAAKLKDKKGRLLLHCIADHGSLFMDVFMLYPDAERLEALRTTDCQQYTVLELAQDNLALLTTILNALPDADRIQAIQLKYKNGQSLLYSVRNNPLLLGMWLHAVPASERLIAVKTAGDDEHALLQATSCESLVVLLNALPLSDRLEATKIKAGEGHTLLNFVIEKLPDVIEHPDVLRMILNLYLPSDRLVALRAALFHSALLRSELFQIILNELPMSEREAVPYFKDDVGRTLLHFSVKREPKSFTLLLNLIPLHERLNALKIKSNDGKIPLHDAGSELAVLLAILILYPPSERLLALQVEDNHGRTGFEDILGSPESMVAVLRLLPVSDRLQAVHRKKSWNKQTALYALAKVPALLIECFKLLSPSERLEAMKTTDNYGRTPLYAAIDEAQSLTAMLALYRKSKRFELVSCGPDEETVLQQSVRRPESFIAILRALPANKRLQAVRVKHKGRTALHYAASEHALLFEMLNLLSPSERLEAVKITDDEGRTLLRFTAKYPKSLNTVLTVYPDVERPGAVKQIIKEGRSLLFYATENPQSLATVLNFYSKSACLAAVKGVSGGGLTLLHVAAQNARSLGILMNILPPRERLDAVTVQGELVRTVLYYAAQQPDVLHVLLASLPAADRLTAVKINLKDGCNALHYAAEWPRTFIKILNLYAPSDRLAAVYLKNDAGRTPFDDLYSCPKLLCALFKALPESDRYDVVQKNIEKIASPPLFKKFKQILISGLVQEEKAYPGREHYFSDVKKQLKQASSCDDLKAAVDTLLRVRELAFYIVNSTWFINIVTSSWTRGAAITMMLAGVMMAKKGNLVTTVPALSVSLAGASLAGLSFFTQRLSDCVIEIAIKNERLMNQSS